MKGRTICYITPKSLHSVTFDSNNRRHRLESTSTRVEIGQSRHRHESTVVNVDNGLYRHWQTSISTRVDNDITRYGHMSTLARVDRTYVDADISPHEPKSTKACVDIGLAIVDIDIDWSRHRHE